MILIFELAMPQLASLSVAHCATVGAHRAALKTLICAAASLQSSRRTWSFFELPSTASARLERAIGRPGASQPWISTQVSFFEEMACEESFAKTRETSLVLLP